MKIDTIYIGEGSEHARVSEPRRNSTLNQTSLVPVLENWEDGSYWHAGLRKFFAKAIPQTSDEIDRPVISLFSGAGGLDLGLERAGFRTAVCIENDADCRATLSYNRPEWIQYGGNAHDGAGDVRTADPSEILDLACLEPGETALVVGGAPCQPFSNMGKRQGRLDAKNGDLFLEFVRIVRGVQPRGILFENVKGIAQARHEDVIRYMREHLEDLGYSLTWATLNAADYGVPQRRERFFLLGTRTGASPSLPLPSHFESLELWNWFSSQFDVHPAYEPERWVTVGEAFGTLPNDLEGRNDCIRMNISKPVRNRMKHIGPGENFHALPMKLRPQCWQTGRHQGRDTFGRMRLDRPAHTIRTAAYNPSKGQYIHPLEHRGLNTLEMARLQSFPIDWRFRTANGRLTLVSAGRQIGNAVPPRLAEALGNALRASLDLAV